MISDVQVKGSWIEVCDANGKKISTMSSFGKDVRGAAGSTFTVKSGSWIETYDKNCNRINTRSA